MVVPTEFAEPNPHAEDEDILKGLPPDLVELLLYFCSIKCLKSRQEILDTAKALSEYKLKIQ